MLASRFARHHRNRYSSRGFTLLEVLFASVVLTVGLLGLLVMVVTSISTNNRNKLDTNGTLIAQATLEAIASVPGNSTTAVTVVDCNPASSSASHTVSTTGSAGGAGANLNSSGNIDFTEALGSVPSNYSMQYYACQASTGDRWAIYDVRWNIKTLTGNTKLVTVAAQRTGSSSSQPVLFAVPVSLKSIVGL